jgi:hypothetical protein
MISVIWIQLISNELIRKKVPSKPRMFPADKINMGNAISMLSMLTGSAPLQSTGLQAGIAMLKKSNDIARQEGEALIQLIEESAPQPNPKSLDVYA